MSENANASGLLSAVSVDEYHTTPGPKKIKRLGRKISFDMAGSAGKADEEAAVKKNAMRAVLKDSGFEFGDGASEDDLARALQEHFGGRRVKIIVVMVDSRDRRSVLNAMKHMDKMGDAAKGRMLDYAIANLGMLDQDENRDKLCDSIQKNRKHLLPQHGAALEGMSRDPRVAGALTAAGYKVNGGKSYADMVDNVDKFPPVSKDRFLANALSHLKTLQGPDRANERTRLLGALENAREKAQLSKPHLDSIAEMAKSNHDLQPLIDGHRSNPINSPQPREPKQISEQQKSSKRQDMIRGRETMDRGGMTLSLA